MSPQNHSQYVFPRPGNLFRQDFAVVSNLSYTKNFRPWQKSILFPAESLAPDSADANVRKSLLSEEFAEVL